MAEIINPREAETLRTVVSSLARKVDELTGKVDEVVTAQGKVDTTLQEMATAKRTGTPVQFMKAETVEKAIEDKLKSQLVNSTITVKVNDPVASIGKQSKEKISGLIAATKELVESNKAIKPRKPLINITIFDGRKAMWIGIVVAGLFLIGMIWTIIWAKKEVNSIQDQAFYWADRAYQSALLRDDEHPGENYHLVMSHFKEEPEKAKRVVAAWEIEAERYQEVKHYLLSIIKDKDPRDIRVLAWEVNHGEGWFRYRFYDEETERSIHVWPDEKVEETTDKIVSDLASAQKYSKRKIWTTIKDAEAQHEE